MANAGENDLAPANPEDAARHDQMRGEAVEKSKDAAQSGRERMGWPTSFIDLAVVLIATVVASVLFLAFDVYEKLYASLQRWEAWEVDDVLLALVVLAAGLGWLSWRRWKDALRFLHQRKRAEEALRKAYDELERRVEERTAEIQQRLQEQTMLFDASQRLVGAPLQVEGIADMAVRQLARVMGNAECSFSLFDPQENALQAITSFWVEEGIGHYEKEEKRLYNLSDYPATARVMETLQPLVVQASDPNSDSAEQAYMEENDATTLAIIPLAVKGQAIGVMELETWEERHYMPEQLNMAMTLANQVAVAVENAQLYEALQQKLAERVQAEEALRESEERYRMLVKNAPLGIFSVDTSGQIKTTNPALLEILGSPSVEATMAINVLESPLLVEAGVSAWLRRCMESGKTVVTNLPYRSKWGKDIYVRLHLNPIRDAEGEVVGTHGLIEDITERKQAEDALKEYSERLEEMVEERTKELRDAQTKLFQSEKLASTGRLAASVAHEINNPLQGITNYLSLISQQVTQDDLLHANLDMVKLGFDRIAEIVRRLRAFYRPAGEEMEPTDINGVVERVLALVGHQLALGNIEVKTELAEHDLPVLGSVGQLEQVLVNLALNAQEAMPQGGELIVRTTLHEDMVQLQVMDSGRGISENEMSKLFKPFYNGKEGTGLGLGLWISHNIIEGHGGSIEAEGQVGEGTTFTISLPVYQ